MSLEEEIQRLPDLPGVYLMLDKLDSVIYIGKAKSLRKRVKSYFGKSADSRFLAGYLLARVKKVDYLITDTEKKDIKVFTDIIKNLEKEAILILNADDPGCATLKKCAPCRVMTFGTKKADICAGKIKKQKQGQGTFTLHVFKDTAEITAKASKEASLSDCLAAAAAAYAAGLGIDEIKQGLEGAT